MADIHILNSETIDKIAAGEVVERPGSVVKELVENAIDAGATAVTVEAKDGGIEFIRVTDNGCGMGGDQLRTAFLRHATSKIENADDLMRVSSLGFRGEALSSIAAVSKVEVITKTPGSITGSRILLEGAKEISFGEVGAPDGTTFVMRNLFYNTPVRRKFLKQPATEGGYIADLMEHLALSRPDISIKLVLGSQMKFHTSGNGDLREVIYRIYGRDVANALVPISTDREGIRVEGYLGKPVQVRSNRNFEIYFINGRFIRSNVIARSIEEGYKEYLMQHKFPLCVLHIAMDPGRVDVNVHPTKMDVRFSDTIAFSGFLTEAVRQTLRQQEMIPEASLSSDRELRERRIAERKEQEKKSVPEPFEQKRSSTYRVMEEAKYAASHLERHDFTHNPVWNRVKGNGVPKQDNLMSQETSVPRKREEEFFFEETSEILEEASEKPGVVFQEPDKTSEEPGVVSQEPDKTSEETGVVFQEPETISQEPEKTSEEQRTVSPEPEKTSEEPKAASETMQADLYDSIQPVQTQPDAKAGCCQDTEGKQLNLFEEKILTMDNRSRYRIIGQVFETYWLIEFEDRLLMIDQHAAHEKVNYERLIKQYREKNVLSQGLMPPVIVTLSGQEEAVLKEHLDTFAALGFEVEAFGGSEYALRSVPVDLYGCNEREMFLEVLDSLLDGTNFGNLRVIEEKIASMSCKAAVKGNHKLSVAEAEALIDELLTLENPYNCPHGRPTIVTMTKTEMERKFKRIVS
ncbi:MAG TPA: DNA mismatch repair endonuclease MutL [Lachnospiraceae bacterium]|nr:DNA mismatch repair endonuclease MutL [Lachnospiraceae bacterium]